MPCLIGGVGHVIFSLHLGVGHSVLLQLEGVGHVFSNHHISKCSGPAPPVLFDQSLTSKSRIMLLANITVFGFDHFSMVVPLDCNADLSFSVSLNFIDFNLV